MQRWQQKTLVYYKLSVICLQNVMSISPLTSKWVNSLRVFQVIHWGSKPWTVAGKNNSSQSFTKFWIVKTWLRKLIVWNRKVNVKVGMGLKNMRFWFMFSFLFSKQDTILSLEIAWLHCLLLFTGLFWNICWCSLKTTWIHPVFFGAMFFFCFFYNSFLSVAL